MVVKRADEVKLVVFVCEAGMGSSLIGANQLKKKIKDAGLNVRVIHSPVNEIPAETDVVVAHEGAGMAATPETTRAQTIPIFKPLLFLILSPFLSRPGYGQTGY